MLRRLLNPAPIEYIETNDQYPWSEAAIRNYRTRRKHIKRRMRLVLIVLMLVLMFACVAGCFAYSKSSNPFTTKKHAYVIQEARYA